MKNLFFLACLFLFQIGNSQSVTSFSFDPYVMPSTRTTPILFEVKIQGSITDIYIEGYNNQNLPLNDAGMAGDKVAGDNIFTVSLTPAYILGNFDESRDVYRSFVGFLTIFNGTQRIIRGNIFAEIYTDELPIVKYCSHTHNGTKVNIAPNLINIESATSAIDIVQLFELLNDLQFSREYDFINFVQLPAKFANGHHVSLKNEVEGIGVSIFENSILNNPIISNRLQGYNVFPSSNFFDGASDTQSHEIGHQWSSFLGSPYSGCAHWGFCSIANSTMGFDLTAANGCQGLQFRYDLMPVPNSSLYQFQNTTNFDPTFSDMDLYLMGLLAPESVAPFRIINDQSAVLSAYLNGNITNTQWETTEVTVNDIIAQQGARNPSSATSRKDFNLLTVALSPTLLSEEALSFYNYFAKRAENTSPTPVHRGFSYATENPFFVSTKGLGTLNTAIVSLDGSCFSSCVEAINLTENPAVNTTFKASTFLISTSVIDAPLKIVYEAGDSIVLKQDFEVKAGATFTASIKNCTIPPNFQENIVATSNLIIPEIATRDNAQPPIKNIELAVFPNPMSYHATINFSLPKASSIQLNLYDLNGQMVQSILTNQHYETGNHQLTLNSSDFQAGVYYLNMVSDTAQLVRKVIIQH